MTMLGKRAIAMPGTVHAITDDPLPDSVRPPLDFVRMFRFGIGETQ